MDATERLGSGYSDVKIERRRPSKRQTTLRTFTIVRNWETNQIEPERTPVKEDTNQLQLDDSPVFPPPPPSRPSFEIHVPRMTSSSKDAFDYVTATNSTNSNVSYQPIEEKTEHFASNDSPETSIVVDSTLSPMAVQATSENEVQVALKVPIAVSPAKTIQNHEDTTTTAVATRVDSQSPRITRGRKRKQDVVLSQEVMQAKHNDEDDSDYQCTGNNNFVRIFNADQGRKVTLAEITPLDVALTAIEEVALEFREEMESDITRQFIKEFFILVRKTFGESIDMQKDYETLKSDHRKVNSKIKRRRGELLEVQKKRARIRGESGKWKKKKMEIETNGKDLLEISEYLHQVGKIQKSCICKDSALQDKSVPSALPSLLSQTQGLLSSASKLKSINSSLEKMLC